MQKPGFIKKKENMLDNIFLQLLKKLLVKTEQQTRLFNFEIMEKKFWVALHFVKKIYPSESENKILPTFLKESIKCQKNT